MNSFDLLDPEIQNSSSVQSEYLKLMQSTKTESVVPEVPARRSQRASRSVVVNYAESDTESPVKVAKKSGRKPKAMKSFDLAGLEIQSPIDDDNTYRNPRPVKSRRTVSVVREVPATRIQRASRSVIGKLAEPPKNAEPLRNGNKRGRKPLFMKLFDLAGPETQNSPPEENDVRNQNEFRKPIQTRRTKSTVREVPATRIQRTSRSVNGKDVGPPRVSPVKVARKRGRKPKILQDSSGPEIQNSSLVETDNTNQNGYPKPMQSRRTVSVVREVPATRIQRTSRSEIGKHVEPPKDVEPPMDAEPRLRNGNKRGRKPLFMKSFDLAGPEIQSPIETDNTKQKEYSRPMQSRRTVSVVREVPATRIQRTSRSEIGKHAEPPKDVEPPKDAEPPLRNGNKRGRKPLFMKSFDLSGPESSSSVETENRNQGEHLKPLKKRITESLNREVKQDEPPVRIGNKRGRKPKIFNLLDLPGPEIQNSSPIDNRNPKENSLNKESASIDDSSSPSSPPKKRITRAAAREMTYEERVAILPDLPPLPFEDRAAFLPQLRPKDEAIRDNCREVRLTFLLPYS